MLVQNAVELFLRSKRAAGLSERTIDWYEMFVTRFVDWLPESGCVDSWWQPVCIEEYLLHLGECGLAPASVAGAYRALNVWFGWMVERNYIDSARNPMPQVTRPKVPRKAPRRSSATDYRRLVDSVALDSWLGYRDCLAMALMYLCALRVSEVAQLQRNDADVTTGLVRIRNGKGGQDRFVPMLPEVKTALVSYVMVRPPWPTDHLLLSADGSHLNARGLLTSNGLRQMLRRRCSAAGVDYINPHAFRHGLAMRMLNAGGDMSLVQKVLGHKRITTTAAHYAEWVTEGMVQEFVRVMGTHTDY